MGRWIKFLIAILVGIAAGLFYAWIISPVEYSNTTPDALDMQFKTDYVLMAAEAYRREGDLGLAVQRLARLGNPVPADMVRQAVTFAQKAGYNESDLTLMRALGDALVTYTPVPRTPTP